MHAYLFIGGDYKEREIKLNEFAKKETEVTYDMPLKKIEDVRNFEDFCKFTKKEITGIIVKDFDKATIEAQNAFLKTLEEPKKNLKIFLSCLNESSVIPTVLSRCQIVRVKPRNSFVDIKIAKDFIEKSVGEKFKYIEKIKKKDEALIFLENLTLSTHRLLVKDTKHTKDAVKIIKYAQIAILQLNSNANVSLQMTNFAVKSSTF